MRIFNISKYTLERVKRECEMVYKKHTLITACNHCFIFKASPKECNRYFGGIKPKDWGFD